MYPVIHIFGFSIYPYGLMIGIGLMCAILLFVKRCKNRGYDEDSAFNLAIFCGISGILGAKLFYIIIEFPELIKDPMLIIKDFSNGFVFYGGAIIGILTGYFYTRVKKWPFLKMLDIAVPSIPLAHAFGRAGCLFAGCCYGQETDSVFGITFSDSPYAPHDVSLIPTQIISSIGNLAIFAILLWFDNKKKKRDGQTGALYLIIYSIGRFIIEFFRGDPRGTVFNVLSASQFICIFVFAAGIIMMYVTKRVSKSFEAEAAAAIEDSETGIKDNNQDEAHVVGDKPYEKEMQSDELGSSDKEIEKNTVKEEE